MRGCYIGNSQVLVDLTWGGKMIVNANDRSLAPELIIHGFYDKPLTNFMIKNVKPGQIFVDVGANMGLFTILAGYLVGSSGYVAAFEANPDHYELIRENIAMNYLTQQVDVLHAAIYSERKTMVFHATKKFMGNGSLVSHDENYKQRYINDSFAEYEVEAVTLDEMFNTTSFIHMIKIDIEGGEYHAFLGLQEKIKKQAVGTIIFELNKAMLKENWFSLYSRLEEFKEYYGYTFYVINDEGDLISQTLDEIFEKDEVPAVVMKLN